jgi:glutamate--cysteine ligase
MTNDSSPPVDKQAMIDWVAHGECPAAEWRIGTEHEKFLFRCDDHAPVGYDGPNGVGKLLTDLLAEMGSEATPIIEKGQIIGLKDGAGGSVTLEPGGQLELSGAPLENLHQTCAETGRHLRHMRTVADPLRIGMMGLGYHPMAKREDISFMPKGRYQIMRTYMPKVGTLGLDMMVRSCTVQVNLDYSDEADMRRKFRTSLALQPVATALFANSPFKEGQVSPYLSTRAHAWTDTDAARCGVPACVFDPNFGYEQWIDYILDVPMYFVHRGEDYVDVAGHSFRDFMAGNLAGFEGQVPTMADFEDHMTTAFPEVRLKQFLEMRGADSGMWSNICALPAFWVGLLYDQTSLDAATALAADIGPDDVMAARLSVATDGFNGTLAGHRVYELASQLVALSREGLQRRAITDSAGNDESGFLSPLGDCLQTQMTPAEALVHQLHGGWGGDLSKIFTTNSF